MMNSVPTPSEMPDPTTSSPIFGTIESEATAELIRLALAEDLGEAGDRTATALIDADATGAVAIRCRQEGIVCGLPVVTQLFESFAPDVRVTHHLRDGQAVDAATDLATLEGPVRSLLAGERTALNFLGHLSGIATQTAAHVAAIAGTGAQVLDTRKTLPGWRRLAKYAVACGGGTNHRMGLFDAVLIKDNHLASRGNSLDVASAVSAARVGVEPGISVQVEVDTLEQLTNALDAMPDMVLLDNMPPDQLARAVELRNRQAPGVLLEASGGITLDSLAEVAATGVDRVSMGRLTHSVSNWDVGFDWID
jgi:nicotinate-nucleotide pyrophosphorylase (carboxylating)